MKFAIERAAAAAAINAVYATVQRRGTIPILFNFLLEARADTLTITSTDLNMQASVTMPARVDTPGRITLPADKLNEIVRALPDGADMALEFMPDNSRMSIRAGRSRFMVPTLPAEDFPVIASPESPATLTMGAGALGRIFEIGSFCASQDESRGYLMCGYLHLVDGNVRMVSTDGKRLSFAELPAPSGFSLADGASIPTGVVATTRRLLGLIGNDDPATLVLNATKGELSAGRVRLVFKLLDGSAPYVQYSRMFPPDRLGTIEADVDLLTGALTRALIMSDVKDRTVLMDLTDGNLSLVARSFQGTEVGEAGDELAVKWDGLDHTVSFNGAIMLEILGYVQTESVLITIPPDHRGMTIRETGTPDWCGLMGPVRK